MSNAQAASGAQRIDAKPTSQLLHSADVKDQAQLQWRLGLPLMAIVVSLCAVPIGRLRPLRNRPHRPMLQSNGDVEA